jgi:phage regulator Rha-like protein
MSTDFEIIQVEGEHRIDSRLVAQSLGIEHESFMRTLSTYEPELQELGILRFEIGEIRGRGQPQKYVLLNEDQAIFAATLSRNTRQVVTFKLKLTKAFSEARKQLQASTPAIHTFTDALRPRALENLNQVPDGYFSVMSELFKHLYNLEALLNQAIDNKAMLEISVGLLWSKYAREVLNIPDQLRHRYKHHGQGGRIVEAWAYPMLYANTFAKWLWSVYFPLHFPAYQQYRTKRIAQPAQKQLPPGKGA